jgi:hypothetical protein
VTLPAPQKSQLIKPLPTCVSKAFRCATSHLPARDLHDLDAYLWDDSGAAPGSAFNGY